MSTSYQFDLLRTYRYLRLAMVVIVVLQIYINGAVESWTVAGSFGQRRFDLEHGCQASAIIDRVGSRLGT